MAKKNKLVDSALWRAKVEDMIKRGTNVQEEVYVKCSLKDWKQFDHTRDNGTVSCINEFIGHIDKVEVMPQIPGCSFGYDIMMDNGDSIMILDDGTLVKRSKGNRCFTGAGETNSGHLRTTVSYPRQTSIFLERLMLIAHCIYNDCLPSSLDGVSCNVKDSSGSVANEFGAEYNISPDNLEFCTVSMNSKAYQTAKKLYELTGRLYRISAYDVVLHEAVFNRPLRDVLWYINRVGIQVV